MIKPVYEFLLWDNCHNNCKFCFQRNKPRLFNIQKRQEILEKTINFIDSDKFIPQSHVLIVGGEIFDSLVLNEVMTAFFEKIVERMLTNRIDLLYINTNMIYKDMTVLYNMLNLIQKHNLFNRLKFTTSYDIEGRFATEETRQQMLNNLLKVKEDFKDINIVTNIILTKQCCEVILNGTFNTKEFMDKYNCWINFIPYIIYLKELTADKKDIFKALSKINRQNPGYLDRYIGSFDNGQDKYLYYYDNNDFVFCSCENSECGHAENFKRYSEDGTCFICDLKNIFD